MRNAFASSIRLIVLLLVLAGILVTAAGTAGSQATPTSSSVAPSDEIVELRGRMSRTHALPEGKYRAEISSTPVNYRDEQGRWQVLDSTLVPAAGGYQNRANDVRVFVPANLAAPVRVEKDGAWASFQLIGAEAEAKVDGASATYADAASGVDARYTATATGVKEELILRDASAQSEFRFVLLTAPGLVPRLRDDAVELADAAGETMLSFRPPFMVDGSGTRNSFSRAVSFSLADDAAPGYLLTLTADRAWLDNPERVYPVTIDPTLDTEPAVGDDAYMDCWIEGPPYADESKQQCKLEWFSAGHPAEAGIWRSLVRWDVSDVPSNANVLEAEMVIGVAAAATTSGLAVSVHELTHPYTKRVTWNRYDGTNAWPGGPGGNFVQAPETSTTVPSGADEVSFYPTGLVQGWVAGTKPNNGMLLKADDEALDEWVDFWGADHIICPPCGTGPKLYVTYEEEQPPQEDNPEAPAYSDQPAVEAPDPEPTDCDDPNVANDGACPSGSGAAASAMAMAGTEAVTTSSNSHMFKVRNADGIWWISKICRDRDLGGGFRETYGQGYIYRMQHTRTGEFLVDDARPRQPGGHDIGPGYINSVNGGLGTFGWHHARGQIDHTQAGDDPTTEPEPVEPKVGRPPSAIEGRMCAASQLSGVDGAGAYARNWWGPTPLTMDCPGYQNASCRHFTFDVWFRDQYGDTGFGPNRIGGSAGDAIARVRYRYTFYKSAVRQWISVTTFARPNGTGTPFVKEPKFAAVVRKPVSPAGYRRISVFGGSSGTRFRTAVMRGQPEGPGLKTGHSAANDRLRARWDYGTGINGVGPNGDQDPSSAPCSEGVCFNAVMEAHTTAGAEISRYGRRANWEGSGLGLDRWAVCSGTTQCGSARLRAYPRDTRGGDSVSGCGIATPDGASETEKSIASQDASPHLDGRRRWEHGGFKDAHSNFDENPNRYRAALTFFNGWDDETGPDDCEPLQRVFGPQGESWGSHAIFSVDSGWSFPRP
jgi:hypothetical protein